MFFENRLIIGYIYEPEINQFTFQLAGGTERSIDREEFFRHLEIYRNFEARQAIKYEHEYRPLPVTIMIQKNVELFPINVHERKRAHKMALIEPPALAAAQSLPQKDSQSLPV